MRVINDTDHDTDTVQRIARAARRHVKKQLGPSWSTPGRSIWVITRYAVSGFATTRDLLSYFIQVLAQERGLELAAKLLLDDVLAASLLEGVGVKWGPIPPRRYKGLPPGLR